MARYELGFPDGVRLEVNAPDDMPEEQVLAEATRQWEAQQSAKKPEESIQSSGNGRNYEQDIPAWARGIADNIIDPALYVAEKGITATPRLVTGAIGALEKGAAWLSGSGFEPPDGGLSNAVNKALELPTVKGMYEGTGVINEGNAISRPLGTAAEFVGTAPLQSAAMIKFAPKLVALAEGKAFAPMVKALTELAIEAPAAFKALELKMAAASGLGAGIGREVTDSGWGELLGGLTGGASYGLLRDAVRTVKQTLGSTTRTALGVYGDIPAGETFTRNPSVVRAAETLGVAPRSTEVVPKDTYAGQKLREAEQFYGSGQTDVGGVGVQVRSSMDKARSNAANEVTNLVQPQTIGPELEQGMANIRAFHESKLSDLETQLGNAFPDLHNDPEAMGRALRSITEASADKVDAAVQAIYREGGNPTVPLDKLMRSLRAIRSSKIPMEQKGNVPGEFLNTAIQEAQDKYFQSLAKRQKVAAATTRETMAPYADISPGGNNPPGWLAVELEKETLKALPKYEGQFKSLTKVRSDAMNSARNERTKVNEGGGNRELLAKYNSITSAADDAINALGEAGLPEVDVYRRGSAAFKHMVSSENGGLGLRDKGIVSDMLANANKLGGYGIPDSALMDEVLRPGSAGKENVAALLNSLKESPDEFAGSVKILRNHLWEKLRLSSPEGIPTQKNIENWQKAFNPILNLPEFSDMAADAANARTLRAQLDSVQSLFNKSNIRDAGQAAFQVILSDNPKNVVNMIKNGTTGSVESRVGRVLALTKDYPEATDALKRAFWETEVLPNVATQYTVNKGGTVGNAKQLDKLFDPNLPEGKMFSSLFKDDPKMVEIARSIRDYALAQSETGVNIRGSQTGWNMSNLNQFMGKFATTGTPIVTDRMPNGLKYIFGLGVENRKQLLDAALSNSDNAEALFNIARQHKLERARGLYLNLAARLGIQSIIPGEEKKAKK